MKVEGAGAGVQQLHETELQPCPDHKANVETLLAFLLDFCSSTHH